MRMPILCLFMLLPLAAGAQTPAPSDPLQDALLKTHEGSPEQSSTRLEEVIRRIVSESAGSLIETSKGSYASAEKARIAKDLARPSQRRFGIDSSGEITDLHPIRVRIGHEIVPPSFAMNPIDQRSFNPKPRTAVEIQFFDGLPPISIINQTVRIELCRPTSRITFSANYSKDTQRYNSGQIIGMPFPIKLNDKRYYGEIHIDLSRRQK